MQSKTVEHLLEDMASRISKHGFLLQPAFAGYDRCHEMCVAKEQVSESALICHLFCILCMHDQPF